MKISSQEFRLLKKSSPAQMQVSFVLKLKQPASIIFPGFTHHATGFCREGNVTFSCYVSGKVNSIVKKLVISQAPN